MPLLKVLLYYLWIAPHLLLVAIVAIMARRRFFRVFPLFFAYVLFEIVQFGILFSLSLVPSMTVEGYFRLYSLSFAVSTALRFGIILDIWTQLFQKYSVLEHFGKSVFRWITVGLLVAGLGLAAYGGGDTSNRAWYVLNMLNRTALILQTGLLLGLFSFSRYMSLSRSDRVFGIALGVGVYAAVDLVAAAIRSQTGFAYTSALDYASMTAYHGSVLIWMVYLLAPERKAVPGVQEAAGHHELEAWNQELERLLHR
jgi:hypothetical protein